MRLPLMLGAALTFFPAFNVLQEPIALRGTPDTPEIAGVYECTGRTADGTEYHGIVHISRQNGAFQVLWTLGPGEQHLGFGVLNGNVLAVSYYGGMPGVVAYRVEKDDDGTRLEGQWTVPEANGEVYRETLTRVGDAAAIVSPEIAVPAPPVRHPLYTRLIRSA